LLIAQRARPDRALLKDPDGRLKSLLDQDIAPQAPASHAAAQPGA
jgi:hypothetical protein